MTNSDQNISKPLDSVEEQFLQEISIPKHISQEANNLFKAKKENPKDFLFEQEKVDATDDIEDLADNLFDALYDHTNKY